MCEIVRFSQFSPANPNIESTLENMGQAIYHRGPDPHGTFIDYLIVLCLRHLSIIDLSETGHLPMSSPSGRYTTFYKVEIYNFKSLRSELEIDRFPFRGNSDTEVHVRMFEKEGKEC